MDDDTQTFGGMIPEGMTWCPNCNGYGSSLSEGSGRCSRCAGTGLIRREAGDETHPAHPRSAREDGAA
jgi:DnaJ-class molecular chaperone